MPFVIGGTRRHRLAGIAAGLAALCLAPAAEAAPVSNPYDCRPQAQLSQTFATFGDHGQYTPVQNAGFEQGAAGWTLSGGAAVVDSNEPWRVGGAADAHALDLPGGSSAVTAPVCIDETYPYFRLFSRKLSKGPLKIDVLFFDDKGNLKATKPFDHAGSGSAWQPTATIKIGLFDAKTTVDAAPVAFRFSAGKDTHFEIDDVYVDPMCRR